MIDFRNSNFDYPLATCTPPSPHRNKLAIVIDTGSMQWRAGFADNADPSVCFEPIVHRVPGLDASVVGRHAGLPRPTSSRTPYDESAYNGILNQQGTVQTLLEHVWAELGVASLHTGVAVTEVLGNPPAARGELCELLFEAYAAPKATFLLDSICAALHKNTCDTFISVHVGHNSTAVSVVHQGRMLASRRISFGGGPASELMLRLLQLRYPHFPAA